MILKGSQRGGAAQLAAHLLKTEENEHVEIHEISGFVSEDLHGAFKEIYAVSQGTRCRQFMFSLSLNPPEKESVPPEYFEKALADIEEKMGLEGQPRAIVFHEKEGRRHCHAVWSRIDIDEMKAINLPYFKMKLQDISRQLYFQYGWKMPRGLLNKEERNPLNFTLAEWQQAKRLQEDPKVIKQLFQDCWAVSDNKASFQKALNDYGFYLAKGDRRGFVALDYRGEVYSLSRWMNVKTKEIKSRLGELELLASTDDVKRHIAERMTKNLESYIQQAQINSRIELKPFMQKKRALQKHHQRERQALRKIQEDRWQKETIKRSKHLPKGLKAVWYRFTGKYQKIRNQNENETKQCRMRDRDENHSLIDRQLRIRQKLQAEINLCRQNHQDRVCELKCDIARYLEMDEQAQNALQQQAQKLNQNQNQPTLDDQERSPEM